MAGFTANCSLRTQPHSEAKMATLQWIRLLGKGFPEIFASFWIRRKAGDYYLIRPHTSVLG